jgi:hypothetical protein
VPYLRDLALVVAIGAITDNLLDYVFKSQAAETFSHGAQLMSFFAIVNTVFGLLSLGLQAGLSRASLRSLGLAGTVAVRPITVLVASLLGLLDPRMWAAILVRGTFDVNTGSLFRSGYELLFTPLAESEKRPTRPSSTSASTSWARSPGAPSPCSRWPSSLRRRPASSSASPPCSAWPLSPSPAASIAATCAHWRRACARDGSGSTPPTCRTKPRC